MFLGIYENKTSKILRSTQLSLSRMANELYRHRPTFLVKGGIMTRNQILFRQTKETERANRAKEAEDVRSHKASEAISSTIASETGRHNLATEAVNWYTAENLAGLQAAQATQAQANAALAASNVGVQSLLAQEQIRHNVAGEAETTRHQTATEQETTRHNVATEGLTKAHQDIEAFNAGVNAAGQITKSYRDITGGVASLFGGIRR